ncbi:hypothetical protein NLG97_g2977 [Lecanicillium saksenae]|uniref:Uncharacterized protein n=1 Tax=Lecanicillium saksenae TaxID=468837 RepID=A0ACC1R161_9HYPO|nr:hypothetical protein NLG97_g2977 [Lecanicillium saksenae]
MGLYADATPKARKLFYTLRTGALTSLTAAFDDTVWTSDVTRAATSHPALWHAGLAIAATYTRHHHAGLALSSEFLRVCAMHHYGRAMHSLIDLSGQNNFSYEEKETVLLSNVLLIGLCILWQDEAAALAHTKRGIDVFNNWRIWEEADKAEFRTGSITDIRSLVFLFYRLEQRYIIGVDRSETQACQLRSIALATSKCAFASVAEAYAALIPLHIGIYTLDAPAPVDRTTSPSRSRRSSDYAMPFRIWRTNLDSLLALRKDRQPNVESFLLLELWSAMTSALLEGDRAVHDPDDLARQCDIWQPAFEMLLSLTKKSSNSATYSKSNDLSKALPFRCLTVDACDILLFFIKCSSGASRRKIITLLQNWPLKVGLFDPTLGASIARAVIAFEERCGLVDKPSRLGKCGCSPRGFICSRHSLALSQVTVADSEISETKLAACRDIQGGDEAKVKVSRVFW